MEIKRTGRFNKDFKSIIKKNYDIDKFETVLEHILNRNIEILKTKYRDHALKGALKEFRELHIESDWLLVYQIKNDNQLMLILIATGSHDHVFRNSKYYTS
ncbi:mRNA interferase YafQ [Enterococcus sp. AZ150]|uniref:type II toxin-antitoxin system RelE/ParE family toxin n=1 Tax=Enterococcus sp. AZ150 TaxID=2774866 RepID=UPI003F22FFAE